MHSFTKMFSFVYPEEALQHDYKCWRNHVGLKLFDILLEQKYPCIIDITETESNIYGCAFTDVGEYLHSEVSGQKVTIEIDIKAIDIQRTDYYSMYKMAIPEWMEHKKKSFWNKLRFWKK